MAVIIYNGFGGLRSVKINEWSDEAVFADDGLNIETMRHHLSGTAIITETTEALFNTIRQRAESLLNRPRGPLSIELGAETHYDVPGPDDADGPIVSFRFTTLTPLSAIVGFDITFSTFVLTPTAGEVLRSVLSHRFKQEWEIGENGMQRHLVSGVLRVRASASDSALGQSSSPGALIPSNFGRNPEVYRGLVVPPLPQGFRRFSMRFATDETGNRIVYTIEDHEMAHDIPSPALAADGSFSWTREWNDMGIKHLEIELVAHHSTPPIDLLAAAVETSKTMIRYSGTSADHILMIRVERPMLFRENRVRYEVVARCVASGPGNLAEFNPPNFQLLNQLFTNLEGYQDQSVYGPAAVRGLRRLFSNPLSATVPQAQFEAEVDPVVPTAIYLPPQGAFDATIQPMIEPGPETIGDAHVEAPYLDYRASDEIVIADGGMAWLKRNDVTQFDVAVQMRKPTVYLISQIVASRLNMPPTLDPRPAPPGAILKHARTVPTTGDFEASGQRVFAARHVRVLELGYATNSVSIGWPQSPSPSEPFRFWPNADAVNGPQAQMPFDQRVGNQQTGHLFTLGGTHLYTLAPVEPYLS